MYFIPLLICVIFIFLPNIKKEIKLIAIVFPMLIIAIFRFGIGADYFSYEFLYNTLDARNFGAMLQSSMRIEVGYRILQFLFIKFGFSYHVFNAFLSSILMIGYSFWIYRNSKNFTIAMMLFYSMFYLVWILSAQRQAIVMMVGLYVFFDNRIKIKENVKCLIILVLSTIHISALFYFLVYLVDLIDWNKRKLTTLFVFSILFSLLPLSSIVNGLSFIPSRISNYFESTSLFDFASVVRIIFFIFIIIHYDKITHEKYQKRIADYSLMSFIAFFFLKFSGLGASRFTIYFFVLVPLVFENIYETYSMIKLKYIGAVGLISYSSLFLYKELITVISQTGYQGDSGVLIHETVFEKRYHNFNSRFSFLSENKYLCSLEFDTKEVYNQNRDTAKYEIGDKLSTFRDNDLGLFGVLNQNGQWVVQPEFENAPGIYRDVVVKSDSKDFTNEYSFIDLTGLDRSQEMMMDVISQEMVLEGRFKLSVQEVTLDAKYADLSTSVQNMIPIEEQVSGLKESKINLPFEYRIYSFEYYDNEYFIYVGEDGEPLHDELSMSRNIYSRNELLKITRPCGSYYVNKQGKIIWYN